MIPILTTITPYWSREEQLKFWVRSIKKAADPAVRHVVFFVGENRAPQWWFDEVEADPRFVALMRSEMPGLSIGHYHNLGACFTNTEWIMKMDVDCVCAPNFFERLVVQLCYAKEREWFNVGMFYLTEGASRSLERADLGVFQKMVAHNPSLHCKRGYMYPQATNFVCRRKEYLALGGCDKRFMGWGWEDYQQIYMLERYQQGRDPIPGPIDLANVTHRCRDGISRPKAQQLWNKDRTLSLLHKYHACTPCQQKTRASSEANRHTLLDYITEARKNETPPLVPCGA